jgi:hypothetical protein
MIKKFTEYNNKINEGLLTWVAYFIAFQFALFLLKILVKFIKGKKSTSNDIIFKANDEIIKPNVLIKAASIALIGAVFTKIKNNLENIRVSKTSTYVNVELNDPTLRCYLDTEENVFTIINSSESDNVMEYIIKLSDTQIKEFNSLYI